MKKASNSKFVFGAAIVTIEIETIKPIAAFGKDGQEYECYYDEWDHFAESSTKSGCILPVESLDNSKFSADLNFRQY